MDLRVFEKAVREHSLRLGCKLDCHLVFFDKKSSSLSNKKALRKQLAREMEKQGALSPAQKKKILRPGALIQVSFASFSLSHCSLAGGFIIAPARGDGLAVEDSGLFPYLGFDLELSGRAKEKTVLRISNESELSGSPSPSALWSAKESAYKSLNRLSNPIGIRQTVIFDWRAVSGSKVYDYRFSVESTGIKGKGFVCFFEDLVIACAFAD